MSKIVRGCWGGRGTVIAALPMAAVMAAAAPAHAQTSSSYGADRASAEVPDRGSQQASEGAEAKRRPKAQVALDLVLGWGKVPFAVQNLPVSGNPEVRYTREGAVPADVQSFVLGGAVWLLDTLRVDVRLPFTFAGFSPDQGQGRTSTAFGNVEIGAGYAARVAGRGLRLYAGLGVALPTAQGGEIAEGLAGAPAQQVDRSAYDRFSLERAALAARGHEDDALFETHRLGLVPKVGALWRSHGLSIQPYVKVENLIATSDALESRYLGELVGAVRVGYWVRKQFEVALKGWTNVRFAGHDVPYGGVDDEKVGAALEPQIVLRFGPVRPYAGAIVPVAGPAEGSGFVGARIGVAGGF